MNNKIKMVLFVAITTLGYVSAADAGRSPNCDSELSACLQSLAPQWVCKREWDRCTDNR